MTSLTRKLTALSESHRECAALITQLGNTNLSKTLGAKRHGQQDLATQVHNLLKTLEQDAEFLELEIADESDPELRQTLQSKFKNIQDHIRRSRLHYRKAQLASKRATDQSHRLERELVYSTRTSSHHTPTDSQTADDVVLSAASDVTLSLRRTHALLSSSLQQSHFTRETLSASTQALKELSNRYSRVDEIMLSSRKLVVDLIRKNKSDSWYYEKAIWILAATLAWLVFRRFMWGPLWLFVWMPMKSTYWILGNVKGLFMGAGMADVQGIDVLLSREIVLPAVPTMVTDNTDGKATEKVEEKAEEVVREKDSMFEKVGRIIDEHKVRASWPISEEVDVPNPLKRVLQESVEEVHRNPKKMSLQEEHRQQAGAERDPELETAPGGRANPKSRAWEDLEREPVRQLEQVLEREAEGELERQPESIPSEGRPESQALEIAEPKILEAPKYEVEPEDAPNPLKRMWEEPEVEKVPEPQAESIPVADISAPQTSELVDEGYSTGTEEDDEVVYEKVGRVSHDGEPHVGRVLSAHDEL